MMPHRFLPSFILGLFFVVSPSFSQAGDRITNVKRSRYKPTEQGFRSHLRRLTTAATEAVRDQSRKLRSVKARQQELAARHARERGAEVVDLGVVRLSPQRTAEFVVGRVAALGKAARVRDNWGKERLARPGMTVNDVLIDFGLKQTTSAVQEAKGLLARCEQNNARFGAYKGKLHFDVSGVKRGCMLTPADLGKLKRGTVLASGLNSEGCFVVAGKDKLDGETRFGATIYSSF